MIFFLNVESKNRTEAINITDKIKEIIEHNKIKNGLLNIYTPHTTAAITINEAYDPDVFDDFLFKASELFPKSKNYKHKEGNSDAHIKSAIIGNQRFIIIDNGKPVFGRWEGIFFLEFDGPRKRQIVLQMIITQ
jgi:secondary thiamine-phosphate synthase enzyme